MWALAAAACLPVALALVPLVPSLRPRDPPGSWVLTMSDDFDGPTLNASLWNVRNNESHCAPCEAELYVAARVSVANGSLIITTQRDHVPGPGGAVYNWTSGWVDTKGKFEQLQGLWEARVRLPGQNATGAWPAFWTLPNSTQCWPTGGEATGERGGDARRHTPPPAPPPPVTQARSTGTRPPATRC
jgi:beta-glucanase (GH16 family)